MPFAARLGIELSAAAPDRVTGGIGWAEDLCTAAGILHGGVIMSLADSVGAVCAFLNLPDGATTSTIESKTNLIRGVRAGTIEATATPVHIGRTTIVVQTETRDTQGRLVALTTQTQSVTT